MDTYQPTALSVQWKNIPAELTDRPQWVLWRYDKDDERDEWVKVPYQLDGRRKALSNKPKTWGAFPTAIAVYQKGGWAGIGYVFAADDGYCGIDWDKVRDPATGEFAPWARKGITEMASYTEVSPSQTGAKSIIRGRKPTWATNDEGRLAIYDRVRYFAFTGHVLDWVPGAINERQAELETLCRRELKSRDKPKPPPPPPPRNRPRSNSANGVPKDDARIIKVACLNSVTKSLWSGSTDGYATHSEADLALCSRLGFYVHYDKASIDRLFRQSGLMRDKWNRDDYRDETLAKAVTNNGEVFDWSASEKHVSPTGYQVIRDFLTTYYRFAFRRGDVLFSSTFGREVKRSEALSGAPVKLIDALKAASDVPRKDGHVIRERLPGFFKTWAPSVWTDVFASLPEEQDAAEIVEPAADEVKALLIRCFLSLVNFGYKAGAADANTEVQRRTVFDWLKTFAYGEKGQKYPEKWQDIRSYQAWARVEREPGDEGPGQIAIKFTTSLFHQVGIPIAKPNTLAKLLVLYGFASPARRSRGDRCLRLDDKVVQELQSGPEEEAQDHA